MTAKARLTVVEYVYHQLLDGSQPTIASSTFGAWLETDEQVYGPRRTKVGSDWGPLDLGWAKDCRQLVVENQGGAWMVLAVRVPGTAESMLPFSAIPPGESVRLVPACPIFISGEGTALVTAVPT